MTSHPILVTGGAGYIGSHVCHALHQAGFTPVVLDDLSAGHANRVQWGPLEQGDITNPNTLQQVFNKYNPKAVMHFAGQISVPASVSQPLETYQTNTIGSFNLLQAMHKQGVKHIVFSSTAAVYGIPSSVPIAEDAPKSPINPYGTSKLVTEHMLVDVENAYGITHAALRYFNAAGATPQVGLGYQRPNPFHLIPVCMLATLGKISPITLAGTDYPTPDGTAIRDYIHVADLAQAHVLALQALLTDQSSMQLNLGTSHGYSVAQVLETCRQVTGRPVPHVIGPRRPGDPPALVANAMQAEQKLGWKPKLSALEQIIADDWLWHQNLHA